MRLKKLYLLPLVILSITSYAMPSATHKPIAAVAQARVKQIYTEHCFVCHQAGGAGSPKTGVAADWNPRIKQGLDMLLQHTKEGLNFMPAKGACSQCSEIELAAVIKYILAQCPACKKLPNNRR